MIYHELFISAWTLQTRSAFLRGILSAFSVRPSPWSSTLVRMEIFLITRTWPGILSQALVLWACSSFHNKAFMFCWILVNCLNTDSRQGYSVSVIDGDRNKATLLWQNNVFVPWAHRTPAILKPGPLWIFAGALGVQTYGHFLLCGQGLNDKVIRQASQWFSWSHSLDYVTFCPGCIWLGGC